MTQHVFTLTEAAKACNVSKKTLMRKLKRETPDKMSPLEEAGAVKEGTPPAWKVPTEALLAVGLVPNAYVQPEVRQGSELDLTRLEKLEKQLQEERERRLIAETKLEGAQATIQATQRLAEFAQGQLSLLQSQLQLEGERHPKTKRSFFKRSKSQAV